MHIRVPKSAFLVAVFWAGVFLVFPPSPAQGQLVTSGPVPPPGTDMGLTSPGRAAVTLSGVPAYLWHHGCGPTAIGMVIGYFDEHGYPGLVPGSSADQTPEVDAMIADDGGHPDCALPDGDHYQDYACPRDDSGPILPDRSETGGAHASNCVADFMRCSFSSYQLRYGWSGYVDAPRAFEGYLAFRGAHPGSARNVVFAPTTWGQFKAEINGGRPVCLLVDTDGDDNTDHFVTATGYDDVSMLFACRNTWDTGVHWYPWRQKALGVPWGIYGATFFHMADTLRVAADGSGDYPNISQAITYAKDADLILLADGVYRGAGNRGIDFQGKRITLRSLSGDPRSCVIDCEGLDRGFRFHAGETRASVVMGITIRAGKTPYYGDGGGIYCSYASPTIVRCILEENQATFGGGMMCEHDSCRIVDCVFKDNEAVDGGGIESFASANLLVNCLFSGNHDTWSAGGFRTSEDSSVLINCTFAGNASDHGGGALWLAIDSAVQVANCIVWGNGPTEIVFSGGPSSIRYSDVQGGWPGEGNVDLDPQFVDPAAGDLHLVDGSPCVDAGSNDDLPAGQEADLDGNPRVRDGDGDGEPVVDMGAYERPASPLDVWAGPRGLSARRDEAELSVSSPCRENAMIAFRVPGVSGTAVPVRLVLYDVSGRLVLTLLDGALTAGDHTCALRSAATDGGPGSGVYFLRLACGSASAVQRLVVVR